jgi:IS5 family transposase
MMQLSLGLDLSTKRTRKREFLDEMRRVVPWSRLIALIESHYPAGKTGRPPFPIRDNAADPFLQQWFGLSDPAMEEALYDLPLYRDFAGLGGGMTHLPDESTILRFRHLLETHGLAMQIFALINEILGENGLMLKTGSAVDISLLLQFVWHGRCRGRFVCRDRNSLHSRLNDFATRTNQLSCEALN